MQRIVTQTGKGAEALKITRKIRISVTTREVLVRAGGAQTADPPTESTAETCPLCHRNIAVAVSSALERVRQEMGEIDAAESDTNE